MPNTETAILSDDAIAELEKRIDSFPLSPFQARALCATVRALKAENTTLKRHWADTSEDLASALLKCEELQSRLAEVEKERDDLRLRLRAALEFRL